MDLAAGIIAAGLGSVTVWARLALSKLTVAPSALKAAPASAYTMPFCSMAFSATRGR